MELPAGLRRAVDRRAEGADARGMAAIAEGLSARYRAESGAGKRLLTSGAEAVVYSVVRMPATYGAVKSALSAALSRVAQMPRTLLDAGAGTGTASWAADALLDLETVTCLEREDAMIEIGRDMMREGSSALQNAAWVKADLASARIGCAADLVIASYVLNELSEPARLSCVERLWGAARGMLLIVEPGTPEGYRQLISARDLLLRKGARVAAPCPHDDPCPLPEGDWCHFSARVARGRLHKRLKDADVPYEDEKYAYMAFVRGDTLPSAPRVLRHPAIEKGRISLTVCAADGIHALALRKKDGEAYKAARKAEWGDSFREGET